MAKYYCNDCKQYVPTLEVAEGKYGSMRICGICDGGSITKETNNDKKKK